MDRISHSAFVRLAAPLTAMLLLAAGAISTAAEPARTPAQPTAKVDFAHDVLPLLARRCFACHGPDKGEGSLRLTSREGVLAKLDSGEQAVVPGKPDESEMLRRIASDDESTRMPPKDKPLSAEQVALVREWIRSGAEWKNHWAFEPVAPQTPPAVKDSAWVATPVDNFILAKLDERGLAPAPPADKVALLRRATYDLTGLPPTLAEVDAFLADGDPRAFEHVVDRLLASPHHGERWGRHWLDVVRFAESNSYERDGTKPHVWRYRDYVIRAFNDDKPYDQFLREQIAGDELPTVTAETITATGYCRLGVWDDEPADREQAKFDQLDDLITTTSQAMLGLTVNCARCHDHKIDPILQRDYYRLGAMFLGMKPMSGVGPNVEVPIFESPEKEKAYRVAEQELQERRKDAGREFQEFEEILAVRYQRENDSSALRPDMTNLEYRYYRDSWDLLPDFSLLKPESIGALPLGYFDLSPATRELAFGFVFTGVLNVPADGEYTFELDSDDGSRLVVDGQLVAEYDGIHGLGTPRVAAMKLKKGAAPIELAYFQRVGGLGLAVNWSGPGFKQRPLSRLAESKRPRKNRDIRDLVNRHGEEIFGQEDTRKYKALLKKLDRLNGEKVPNDYAFAAREATANPEAMFVMQRGNPHSPGERVEPGFPAVLGGGGVRPPAPEAANRTSQRRLQLADWLASPDNKLTSRVMANRVWQHHFGRGIVRSSNNFGNLGTPPTHPELLDYLASELVRGGWRLKPLHRLIMLSSAYRMSSRPSEAALAADPANDLFSHFDMRRLSAEEARDSILAVDGQLNLKMHGPSIYPEISREVLATQSQPGLNWGKSSPEEQSRRSVYIFVKRSLITPLLSTLDFPETDTSCEARFCTTQPGQALTMLNSQFLNDAAAEFAKRLQREAGDDPTARITLAARLALESARAARRNRAGPRVFANTASKIRARRTRRLEELLPDDAEPQRVYVSRLILFAGAGQTAGERHIHSRGEFRP